MKFELILKNRIKEESDRGKQGNLGERKGKENLENENRILWTQKGEKKEMQDTKL